MQSLYYPQVVSAVNSILDQVPNPEVNQNFHDVQLVLIRSSEKYERKELVESAFKDGWFLGYWALNSEAELSFESASNLVAPASALRNHFWLEAKKELSTAMGWINPAFMDLSERMINIDPSTGLGLVTYNEIATRILERHMGHQERDPYSRNEVSKGCPHGVQGMSKFLIRYLDFINTNAKKPEATIK